MKGWIWVLLGLFVLIMLMSARINRKESFDPSVRVGAGWIAGPQWGASPDDNPVSVYARQVEAARHGIYNVL